MYTRFLPGDRCAGHVIVQHLGTGRSAEVHAAQVPSGEMRAGEGLAEAHRVGVVHRDLSPDNLLLLPGGAVKVIDFGMAKLRDWGVKTTEEQQIGSARYAALELGAEGAALRLGPDLRRGYHWALIVGHQHEYPIRRPAQ